MNNRPARLGKCNSHEVMRQQLEIRVQTVLLIAIFVMVFIAFCLIAKGPTYGVL